MSLTVTYDPVLNRLRLAGTVLGASATQVYVWRSTDNFITSQVLRGGLGAVMSGGVFNIDDYEFPVGVPVTYQMTSYDGSLVQQATFTSAPVTQQLTAAWAKSLARPYLNQAVVIQDISDISQPARGTVHEVVGRSAGIAVSDVRAGRQFTVTLVAEAEQASESIRALIASGDPIYLQLPAADDEIVPTGYFAVGDVARQLAMRRSPRRYWHLELTECAAPGPDVVGAQVTWQTVVSTYATWTATLAANATWNDLLNRIAPPSEVIVP